MTTHELDALRALHEQAVAEGQRLSAEVARLREERDRIAGALRAMLLSADCTWEERRLGHDWAETCDASRAALASLGSPQDERNTKKEDAP
jgi:hypothetical protein